jgi:hypothetical protein
VLQAAGDADLAEKPIGPECVAELGPQHLQRDIPAVLEIPGQVDGGHAPAPELALEAVAINQGVLESLEVVHVSQNRCA